MSSIEEYFLLTDARSQARRIPEDARRELGRILGLGRQRAVAAEALWANGHAAEGLSMIVSAFETTLEAIGAFARAIAAEVPPGAEGWGALLGPRGLASEEVEELRRARDAARAATLPSLDEDVRAEDGALYRRLLRLRGDLERALAPAAMTPKELSATRSWRLAFAGLTLLALAAGAFVALRSPEGVEAEASSAYGAEFPASNVIDGDPSTEWLLPDGQDGWVEVRIAPPARIDTLRVLNAHNRQYNDRATERYRVDLFVNGRVARTIESSFEEFQVRPEWVEHEVGLDGVERVRFEVLSHHRTGGGLAEMEWR